MAARGNTGAKLGTKRSVREEWNYHSRKTRKTLPRGGDDCSGADCLGGRTSRINSYQYEYTPIVSTRRGRRAFLYHFYIIIQGPNSEYGLNGRAIDRGTDTCASKSPH